jgi:hypothetical protein
LDAKEIADQLTARGFTNSEAAIQTRVRTDTAETTPPT